MNRKKKNLGWRIGFGIFALIYTAWVVILGLSNFDKVHSEYRWARERVHPKKIQDIAFQELVDQCRSKASRREVKRIDRYRNDSGQAATMAEDPCLSWPEDVIASRQKDVENRLLVEAGKLKRRMIVFYFTFGIFFLALPLAFLYYLLAFLVWLFRDLPFGISMGSCPRSVLRAFSFRAMSLSYRGIEAAAISI